MGVFQTGRNENRYIGTHQVLIRVELSSTLPSQVNINGNGGIPWSGGSWAAKFDGDTVRTREAKDFPVMIQLQLACAFNIELQNPVNQLPPEHLGMFRSSFKKAVVVGS